MLHAAYLRCIYLIPDCKPHRDDNEIIFTLSLAALGYYHGITIEGSKKWGLMFSKDKKGYMRFKKKKRE